MPKMKTKRGAAKRMKVTAGKKLRDIKHIQITELCVKVYASVKSYKKALIYTRVM
jgi:hypothetical protein